MHPWLSQLVRAPRDIPKLEATPPGLSVRQPSPGFIEFIPAQPPNEHILISVGIHGNETAPIELLDDLIHAILNDHLAVSCHLICILGNPPAVSDNQRFSELNLNRLFSKHHQQHRACYETERAMEIESYLSRKLLSKPDASIEEASITHYDLHTAIRGSEFEKFAVCPFGQPLDADSLSLLESCGIEAVLESHQPTSTFSYFTSEQLGARSFTLELGRAAPFGQNADLDLTKLHQHLRHHISGTLSNRSPEGIERFQVVEELVRQHEDFALLLAENAPNFSQIEEGQVNARDGDLEHRATRLHQRVVFPNANVPIGQRFGLLVVNKS